VRGCRSGLCGYSLRLPASGLLLLAPTMFYCCPFFGVCPIHQRPAVTQVHDAIAVRADRLHAKLFEDAALDTDDKGPAYLEVDSWVRIVAFYLC